jgi:MFS family permease
MFFLKPQAGGESGIYANRNFRLFFSARLVSQLGDQIYVFAVTWYILSVTHSSLMMAVPLLLQAVITACVSLFGGIFADRVHRKKILVLTDIVQGVVLVLMAVLVWYHSLQIWTLYLTTAVLAFCGAVFSPAASALVPDIVRPEQLPQATAANQFIISLCTMAGMLSGGLLFQVFGLTAVLLFNAASNFVSAVMESRLKVPPGPSAKEKWTLKEIGRRSLRDLAEGYRHVRGNRPVFRYLVVNSLFVLTALPVGMVFIPYYFNVLLKSTAMQLAFPQGAMWLGMIAAALIVPAALRKNPFGRLIGRGLIWMSACTAGGALLALPAVMRALGADQISLVWVGINLLVGITVNLFTIPLYTFFQKESVGEFRGRFWGLENSLRTLALSCGYLLAGALAGIFYIGTLFAAYAVVMLALAVIVRRTDLVYARGGLRTPQADKK